MKLLDLFCGAGGCAAGYHRAGFDVTGVDIAPQPNYPFEFVQADALEYVQEYGQTFDVIHASPPCQHYSVTSSIHPDRTYPDLVAETRALLQATGKPHIIENVPGAPLIDALTLCGTMFPGLKVRRHRLFETRPQVWFPPADCCHNYGTIPRAGYGANDDGWIAVAGHFCDIAAAKSAMGIDWMTRDELSQAIPPAYTEWIGKQIMGAML